MSGSGGFWLWWTQNFFSAEEPDIRYARMVAWQAASERAAKIVTKDCEFMVGKPHDDCEAHRVAEEILYGK